MFLACEQSIMAAGQELSKAMSDQDPMFYLDRLKTMLDQAQGAVEVLQYRG